MASVFNRRELSVIFADLLHADRPYMCYRLMIHLDTACLDVLEHAIQEAMLHTGGDQNDAIKMASACAMILKNTYAVGNSGNLLENLAYMLYDRRAELGFSTEEQERIAQIVRTESFCGAGDEIKELYTRAQKQGKPLVDSAIRVLLQYIILRPEGFLDARRLAALLGEYRVTLSFADIATMRALLCAWMLLHVKDKAVTDLILTELREIPAMPEAAKGKDNDAHTIFAYLSKQDRVRLRSIIYRTESTRQVLDTVMQL
jgi:hypothetical protein